MNMMAMYSNCYFKNTLTQLDFNMHCMLMDKQSKSWLEKFNSKEEFKVVYDQIMDGLAKTVGIHAAQHQAVVKWFIFGLNGPFGAVTGVLTDCCAMLGHVNLSTSTAQDDF